MCKAPIVNRAYTLHQGAGVRSRRFSDWRSERAGGRRGGLILWAPTDSGGSDGGLVHAFSQATIAPAARSFFEDHVYAADLEGRLSAVRGSVPGGVRDDRELR